MSDREQQYERALRWYPRSWRDRHGRALMADLMDQDDARGRVAPSSAERRSLALHGIEKRLSEGRAAGIAAVVIGGTLISAAAAAPLEVFALLPGIAITRLVGGVLLGAGLATLLLVHHSHRWAIRPVVALMATAGVVFLGACLFSLLGPVPSSAGVAVSGLGQFVPLGWQYAAYSTFGPALAATAATTVLCTLGGLVAFTSARHRAGNDALAG